MLAARKILLEKTRWRIRRQGPLPQQPPGVEAWTTGKARTILCSPTQTVPAVLLPAAGESGLLLQGSCALIWSPGTVVAVVLVCGGSARLRALLSMTGRRALTGDTCSPAATAAAQRENLMESQSSQGRNAAN